VEDLSGTKISNNVVVYVFKNIITKSLHSFNEICMGDELKLQEKIRY